MLETHTYFTVTCTYTTFWRKHIVICMTSEYVEKHVCPNKYRILIKIPWHKMWVQWSSGSIYQPTRVINSETFSIKNSIKLANDKQIFDMHTTKPFHLPSSQVHERHKLCVWRVKNCLILWVFSSLKETQTGCAYLPNSASHSADHLITDFFIRAGRSLFYILRGWWQCRTDAHASEITGRTFPDSQLK